MWVARAIKACLDNDSPYVQNFYELTAETPSILTSGRALVAAIREIRGGRGADELQEDLRDEGVLYRGQVGDHVQAIGVAVQEGLHLARGPWRDR